MKDKIIKAVAIATVSIISAALVAYLKDPKNRALLQVKAKKAQKSATKQYKLALKKYKVLQKKIAAYQK